MNRLTGAIVLALGLAAPAAAQTVLFDFNSGPQYSPLPIDLSVGGVTAHLSATGQGFSIQRADTMGFTPAGFSGFCIYPSSVYAADLLVGFSNTMTNFSIMFAPQELGCDDTATMRVTGYMNGAFVATNTAHASPPGTWPTGTLNLTAAAGFNSVVVHYDARPPTCGDWGPIFLADNMSVTPRSAQDCFSRGTPGVMGACGKATHARPQAGGVLVAGGSDGVDDAGQCIADWDGDGCVVPVDVASYVGSWFSSLSGANDLADIDCDGAVTPADVAAFVNHWFMALSSPSSEGC